MNKLSLIAKVQQKLLFDRMEREIFKRMSPLNLPILLKKLQVSNRLSIDDLGDFIQKILIAKHRIHKKNPEYKPVILDFARENRIVGLIF